ncbi:MAG: ComF family protein [Halioglobus sp.]
MVNRILDAIFPNNCILCSTRCSNGYPVCPQCLSGLTPNTICCTGCALPLTHAATDAPARICANCVIEKPPYSRVIAPWVYDEQMAYLIHRWKFNKERRLTPLLAMLWLERFPASAAVDMIVPVPLHWLRLCQRGFNQSELLCHQLRAQCPDLKNVTLKTNLARRSRITRSQAALKVTARERNLIGAFNIRLPCRGRKIAIVDDVMTTGSTAAELASALLGAGASSVEVWCLARTPAPAI